MQYTLLQLGQQVKGCTADDTCQLPNAADLNASAIIAAGESYPNIRKNAIVIPPDSTNRRFRADSGGVAGLFRHHNRRPDNDELKPAARAWPSALAAVDGGRCLGARRGVLDGDLCSVLVFREGPLRQIADSDRLDFFELGALFFALLSFSLS